MRDPHINWEGECPTCEGNRLKRIGLWVPGPWMAEDDGPHHFDHAGFPCIVHRGGMGQWCGYVGVTPKHRWHGKEMGQLDAWVDVHGGVTYCETGQGHIRVEDQPDLWFVGFDCGHAWDELPDLAGMRGPGGILHDIHQDYERQMMQFGVRARHDHYWTKVEVIAETKRLAEFAAKEAVNECTGTGHECTGTGENHRTS